MTLGILLSLPLFSRQGKKFPFLLHRRSLSLGKIRKPILSLSLTSADRSHANAKANEKATSTVAKTKKVLEKTLFFRQLSKLTFRCCKTICQEMTIECHLLRSHWTNDFEDNFLRTANQIIDSK